MCERRNRKGNKIIQISWKTNAGRKKFFGIDEYTHEPYFDTLKITEVFREGS